MSESQLRLWKKMIQFIQDYYQGKLSLHLLVDRLEGSLHQADLKDEFLVRHWYELWKPLEEAAAEAAYELETDHNLVQPLLESLKSFLREQESHWNYPELHRPARY